MKKIITVLLMMAVLICGCGEGEKQEVSQEQNQEETEKDNSESGNQETEEEIKETEDMSQAEWIESGGADNMEDGYEKVESINIDSNEAILKYERYEIVEENSSDESGEMKPNIVLYFEFENKNGTRSADSTFNVSVFQNGIKSINWLGGASNVDGNEPIKDWRTETLSGGKLKVGLEFELQDLENPIKIRVDNQKYQESSPLFFQQQELEITRDEKTEENQNVENNTNVLFQKEYEVDGEKVNISMNGNEENIEMNIFGNAKDEEKASIMLACYKKILGEISIDGYSITIKTGEASVIYTETGEENKIMGTNKDGSIAFSAPDWLVTEFTMTEEEMNSFTDEIINTMEDFGESAEMNN